MTRPMYDSVTAKRLPPDALLVGAYVDGHYANEAAVRAQCPHATVVTITVSGAHDAHVIDCETGDATPDQAAAWAAAQVAKGRKPTIYCNESTWPAVKQAVAGRHITVSYFIAHYDGKAEMIPGAVAKQYIERTDQNLDYSIAADYWPGVDPEVKSADVVKPTPVTAPPFHAGMAPHNHYPDIAKIRSRFHLAAPAQGADFFDDNLSAFLVSFAKQRHITYDRHAITRELWNEVWK